MRLIVAQDDLYSPSIGSPCLLSGNNHVIYGRYVGDSNIQFTDDRIILVGTPRNSIIHATQSDVCFDVTDKDLSVLKDFEEDAIEHKEWYHTSRRKDELDNIGTFISPEEINPIRVY